MRLTVYVVSLRSYKGFLQKLWNFQAENQVRHKCDVTADINKLQYIRYSLLCTRFQHLLFHLHTQIASIHHNSTRYSKPSQFIHHLQASKQHYRHRIRYKALAATFCPLFCHGYRSDNCTSSPHIPLLPPPDPSHHPTNSDTP